MALHLRGEQRSDPPSHLLAPGPPTPILQRNLAGVTLVLFEDARVCSDKFLIEHV